jgi:hypothetical protein
VTGDTARFGGKCVRVDGAGEAPCTFAVTAVDGGRTGGEARGDRFTIDVSGADPGGGAVHSGTVEVTSGSDRLPPRP